MSEYQKGILLTFFGVLFVTPDSLFVRLISSDELTIAFWRSFAAGLLILAALITFTGFKNPYLKQDNQRKSFSDLFKMMTTERPNPSPQIEKKLSIDSMIQKINNNNNFITWVGHSTMLLHINGKTILTDPIFSDRCSPVQFLGPKRYSFPTIDIESLPKIDLIVISHNHYDHLDKNSVKNLGKDPLTVWYVPLGLKKWFDKLNITNVIELDWFEERKQDNVEIICLPSQHWSKRSAFKSFDTLWSSWLLKIGNFKFWFAGDTGYNKIQFKQIGDDYGPFDLSAIPIGAYEPRWFMKDFHVNPEESIFIHKDIKSKKSIGMHFGTFVLTTEPVIEPIEKIKNIITNDENFEGEFMIPESGVIYPLD